MKKIIWLLMFLIPFSCGVHFQVGHAKVDSGLQTANKNISKLEAEKIALTKVNGEIVKVELEEDEGKAVYEVKVKGSEGIFEVKIDAKTGKVLEVEKEGTRDGDDDCDCDDDEDDGGHDDHEDNVDN